MKDTISEAHAPHSSSSETSLLTPMLTAAERTALGVAFFQPEGQEEPFRFQGQGNELFKIFIVNLFFSLITLGLYRPWAKARTLRYLYSSLEVYESRFAFHGTGKEIFIGWLKALGVLGGFFGLQIGLKQIPGLHSGWGLVVYSLILYLVLWPLLTLAWLGSRRYRWSRTSWRGIHFRFGGNFRELSKLTLELYLAMLSLGLYYPIFAHRWRMFWTNHSFLGTQALSYKGQWRDLLPIYFKGVLPLLGVVLIWFGMGWQWPASYYRLTQENLTSIQEQIEDDLQVLAALPLLQKLTPLLDLEFPEKAEFQHALQAQLTQEELELWQKKLPFDSAQKRWITLETLVISEATMFPEVPDVLWWMLGISAFLFLLIVIYLFFWVTANAERYFWNHTECGNLHLVSSLTGGALCWQTIRLFCLLLLTFGLAFPWVIVRYQAFYLGCLSLRGTPDFQGLTQAAPHATNATGEGLSTAFELEV